MCGDIILLAKDHNAQFYGEKAEYLTKNRGCSTLLMCTCWGAVAVERMEVILGLVRALKVELDLQKTTP